MTPGLNNLHAELLGVPRGAEPSQPQFLALESRTSLRQDFQDGPLHHPALARDPREDREVTPAQAAFWNRRILSKP